MIQRCSWAQDACALYQQYHDTEWGVPSHEDGHLFEMLILEGFQAGLSWLTILKKRPAFRAAFEGFVPERVAAFGEQEFARLLGDTGIVRNRLKIRAAVANAKAFLQIQQEYGSFASYLWGFTQNQVLREPGDLRLTHSPLSDAVSKDLQGRGMKFVGTVIIYSYLQAVGVINGHDLTCRWAPENSGAAL